jgi:ribosome-associated protein
VDQAQAAQADLAGAGAPDVGQLELGGVADDDRLDVALAVEQDADLAVGLRGHLGEVAGELGRDDLPLADSPAVGVAELLQLALLEAEGVAVDVALDGRLPFGRAPEPLLRRFARSIGSAPAPHNAERGRPDFGRRRAARAPARPGACRGRSRPVPRSTRRRRRRPLRRPVAYRRPPGVWKIVPGASPLRYSAARSGRASPRPPDWRRSPMAKSRPAPRSKKTTPSPRRPPRPRPARPRRRRWRSPGWPRTRKALDVVVLDVRGLATYAEYFVLMTAESEPQLNALADHVEEQMKARGERPLGIEGARGGRVGAYRLRRRRGPRLLPGTPRLTTSRACGPTRRASRSRPDAPPRRRPRPPTSLPTAARRRPPPPRARPARPRGRASAGASSSDELVGRLARRRLAEQPRGDPRVGTPGSSRWARGSSPAAAPYA